MLKQTPEQYARTMKFLEALRDPANTGRQIMGLDNDGRGHCCARGLLRQTFPESMIDSPPDFLGIPWLHLTHLNDTRAMSFREIAAYIEGRLA